MLVLFYEATTVLQLETYRSSTKVYETQHSVKRKTQARFRGLLIRVVVAALDAGLLQTISCAGFARWKM
jgi:hypothetical protein